MDKLLNVLSDANIQLVPKLMQIMIIAAFLKNDIILTYPSSFNIEKETFPPFLPPSVISFLSDASSTTEEVVESIWDKAGGLIWSLDVSMFGDKGLAQVFKEHGSKNGFPSHRTLWPPSHRCTNPDCARSDAGAKMQVADQRQAILYTVGNGPVPVYSVDLRCLRCKTTYFVDYQVQHGVRQYYHTMGSAIQVSRHKYIEPDLILRWKTQMNVSHVSAENCAGIYLYECPDIDSTLPVGWQFKASTLDGEEVFDGFIIISLLEDCRKQGARLRVPHGGLQRDRFVAAQEERNLRYRLYGMPDIDHTCTKCVQIVNVNGEDREVHVVVMDGITLGRPTCSVPRCSVPLRSTKDRFCPEHDHYYGICSIVGCSNPVRPNHRTCGDVDHAAVEEVDSLRRNAAFQRKHQKARAAAAHLKTSQLVDNSDEQGDDVEETYEVVGDQFVPCIPDLPTQGQAARDSVEEADSTADPSLPPLSQSNEQSPPAADHASDSVHSDSAPAPNSLLASTPQLSVSQSATVADPATAPRPKKLTLKNGRSRTHNEQIQSGPCGIMHGRDTFFYAESTPACCSFSERLWTHHRKPNHIIHDNNCSVAKHVRGKRPWFDDVGLAVDVFHFKCKHSKSDDYCQQNCDPAKFPELVGEGGKGWFFNTSIAEQNNAWLGGFQSMCREMTAVRFDFFLDEMIVMRNRITLARLRKQGVVIVS